MASSSQKASAAGGGTIPIPSRAGRSGEAAGEEGDGRQVLVAREDYYDYKDETDDDDGDDHRSPRGHPKVSINFG